MTLAPEQLAELRARLEQERETLLDTHELAVDGTKPVELDQTTRAEPLRASSRRPRRTAAVLDAHLADARTVGGMRRDEGICRA